MNRRRMVSGIVGILVLLLALVIIERMGPKDTSKPNQSDNLSWRGLERHGYFEVFDYFISSYFRDELASDPAYSGRNWTSNSAHIRNAASQSNIIVVPHAVENPRAYFYDPYYMDACRENGLEVILFVHTLAKYAYFLDPRPSSDEEKRELFIQELRTYEERFRPYRDDIVAIYVYDEPWVRPLNVTPGMLVEMCQAAKSVFWDKPVMVMFHRQGNAYSYSLPNGSVVRYDDWIGQTPAICDIVGIDPYFYAYRDDQPPLYRRTGDRTMVERDTSWACSFNRTVALVGQAFDPGQGAFFERDNTDPKISISDGFEVGGPAGIPPGWSVSGEGIGLTDSVSHLGRSSLLMTGTAGGSAASYDFTQVHSVKVSFHIAFDYGNPNVWITLGNGDGEPVRLGFQGREMTIHDGTRVEVINRSVDVSPGSWHLVTIDADADAHRWTVSFDGEVQTRLPYAVLPSTFSRIRLLAMENSTRGWLDDLRIWRDWSFIPLDENETMLYYDVAKKHPQVRMLLWYQYHDSFASALVIERDQLQVENVWEVQRRIWEMIG